MINFSPESKTLISVIIILTVSTVCQNLKASSVAEVIAASAFQRTKVFVSYDGKYQKLSYPNGDVADNKGVCSDLVIRSLRKAGYDLQRLVHEDMLAHFEQYPSRRIWGMKSPDKNIDHRRVPNLEAFFRRKQLQLNLSNDHSDYQPGDIVSWMLPGNLPHIGIVSDKKNDQGVPLIIHNIGSGPELDDMLFAYPLHGHFRMKEAAREID